MGKLEDLKRSLYDPERPREISPKFFNAPKTRSEEIEHSWERIKTAEAGEGSEGGNSNRWMRFGLFSFLFFCLGAGLVGAVFYFGFQKDDLELSILAKDRAESGEKVTYQIFYKNTTSGMLRDLELVLTYPAGSVPLHDEAKPGVVPRTRVIIGELASGQEAKIELEARLFGRENEIKKAEAVVTYRPESSTSRFVGKAVVETAIVRVPLVLSLNVPDNLSSRQEVILTLDYSSNAQAPFDNMSLGVDYPEGFSFVSAEPRPTQKNSIWAVGSIRPGDTGKITIRGLISGVPSERKIFTARVGVYNSLKDEWTPYQVAGKEAVIAAPLLSVEQRINEERDAIVSLGQPLRVRLHYKNNLDIPLKNVSIEVTLKGGLIDPKTIIVDKGFYQGGTDSILWNPNSYAPFSELKAHEEGDVLFSVGLKTDQVQGNTVISEAIIRSADHPAGYEGIDFTYSDEVTAKVSSKLTLSSRASYRSQHMPASGPLPPQVGKKTTYVIIWQLANSLNDLAGAEVRARLAPGISWENAVVPEGVTLAYDANSGIIVWRVGEVPRGAGDTKPAPLIAFRVGMTPAPNQVETSPILIEAIEAVAVDSFTKQELKVTGENLTTELRTDSSTSPADWRVKP